ncbi:MAG: hypothetical protein OQK82_04465 [Candidatus Pacearchaeota archaeon]|nr:hypothetical protein [Candidatus Pacearchaeota archaeon]
MTDKVKQKLLEIVESTESLRDLMKTSEQNTIYGQGYTVSVRKSGEIEYISLRSVTDSLHYEATINIINTSK